MKPIFLQACKVRLPQLPVPSNVGGLRIRSIGDAAEGFGNVVGGLDNVVGGLGDAAGGIGDAVSELGEGVGGAADDIGGAVSGLGDAADDIGGAVAGIVPGSEEPAHTAGEPDREGGAVIDTGDDFIRDEPGFRQSLTHRHVMYPPCAAALDDLGQETRTVFGIPTGMPIDMRGVFDGIDPNYLAAQGYAPQPCSFDHNGNYLGDGWEDQNGDGYADGFTDCTKPYVYVVDSDGLGWYVRELGRDCKYGAPPTRAYESGNGGGGSSGQSAATTSPTQSQPSSERGDGAVPYATATAGTVTRVIDGDTIVVNGDITIRLALVDTPERGESGYEDASTFTRSACPVGTTVIYDVDDGQRSGSYGRTIALVWCGGYGSTSSQAAAPLNELLLEAGHAEIDRRFCTASEFGDDEWAMRGGC